ncbi:MAG: CRISPR system precrRNA processing endoribonuclease RAMP protein Cas6 [Xanthomonadaceae bacterium]|nr:CRISPR system precrRNA processing endoribonuclease RAMP protein Cas6 [Xanthomonadaceae bacterium]
MIPILAMRLRFRAERPLHLPVYPGGLWRSAFGKALRDLCCITGAPNCRGCPALAGCGYGMLYEPPVRLPENRGLASHYNELPQPYVLSPVGRQPDERSALLDVILIGRAARRWREVLDAAAALRLGRQPLRLVEATPLPISGELPSRPGEAAVPQPPPAPKRVRVHLLHPLRLRRENRYLGPQDFDFRTFFTTLCRRISMLRAQEDDLAPLEADYRWLAERAQAVHVADACLRWVEWKRYSARQQREIPMGGIVGVFTAAGDLEPLWSWLWAGQWLHVGKGTVMGLGRYRLEALQ